ncbi:membrane protein [Pseudozyma hubeiensis SY62]|uniref:Membrane protein n=1 Tax=Pseudozyma hubeiensis (strain SY62) TaxID=1305764 RepID=R9NVI6_PSEHS|nr:membrane protein [Pseudozyma hubeiensis SY62]GAC92448.1 membrane protein [Pseudozyma hubeiensis SY62]
MGQIFEKLKMPALPTDSAPSLASSPTTPPESSCFPTSSRGSTNPAAQSGKKPCYRIDGLYRNLTFVPRADTNTLAVPLIMAHMFWSSACEKHGGLNKSSDSSSHSSHHHHDHTSATSANSHTQAFGTSEPSPPAAKIGAAFKKCFEELGDFIKYDPPNQCLQVGLIFETIVDTKLRDFGFCLDANGRYQKRFAPVYTSFTVSENGDQIKEDSSKHTCGLANKTSAPKSGANQSATMAAIPTASAAAKRPATGPNSNTTTLTKHLAPDGLKTIAPSAGKPITTACLTASSASTSASKSATPSTVATDAATAPNKPITARTAQKKRERTQPASLLSDCRRHTSFVSSNSESRKHLSNDASLSDVIKELNRTILRFGVSHGDTLVYIELASLVALLNYAAAFYIDFADNMESYMQNRFNNVLVDEYFRHICHTRCEYIETEEYRSEGSPDSKRYYLDRQKRASTLEAGYTKMVPDTTDLRDGVQTVLFTFVWINYTAYKEDETSMLATWNVVIPLLQTVVVRCARQTYAMRNALTAAQYISSIRHVPTEHALNLQKDLLEVSTALQNLTGSGLAVYSPKRKRDKKGKAWKESLVTCPYTTHLYTVAVADIAFRTLWHLNKAIEEAYFSKKPKKQEKCSKDGCSCETTDERKRETLKRASNILTLVERKQADWKPHMRKRGGKKGQNKQVAKVNGSGAAKKGQEKEPMVRDIISKRLREFEDWSFLRRLQDESRAVEKRQAAKAKLATSTTKATSDVDKATPTTGKPHNTGPSATSTALAKPAQPPSRTIPPPIDANHSYNTTLKTWIQSLSTTDHPCAQLAASFARMEGGELDMMLKSMAEVLSVPPGLTEVEGDKWREKNMDVFAKRLGVKRR